MQLSHCLILVTESSNTAPHGKELSDDLKRHIVALHEDDQYYKKIANTLKLSCRTVTKIIQRFKRGGSTQNRSRVGRPKKLSARAECHIQMLSLKDRRRSAVSIAAEIEEVGGQPVSAQTIHHILHQIGVHGCHFRRKPLLKTIHKKASKQFAEDISTKYMDYWNHILWSDEMKINLFGSDSFKHVWQRQGEEYKDKCVKPTVKHGGGNVMVWGCMSAADVGELHFIEGNMNSMYWEILQQSMIPCLQKLGRKQCSIMTMNKTYIQDDHCFTEKAEGKGGWLTKHVSSLKYPPAPRRRQGGVEEHSSEALVNSMTRRVKADLDNDGGHPKYWQLTWCNLITTFPKGCTHFCWQGFSF